MVGALYPPYGQAMIDDYKRMSMKAIFAGWLAVLFCTLWIMERQDRKAWKADCQAAEKALAEVKPYMAKLNLENTRLNNQRPPGDAKDWDEFWKRVLEAGAGKGENTAP